jgi:hypothetical protein
LATGYNLVAQLVGRAEIRKNAEEASRREVSQEVRQAFSESAKAFSLTTWKPTPDPYAERARLTRRAQRYDRYQHVVTLHTQGFEQEEIAHRVGLSNGYSMLSKSH